MSVTIRWALTLALSGVSPARAPAQEALVRDCAAPCPITVELAVELGDTTGLGEGFVGRPAALLRLGDRGYLLADRLDPGHLKLFDASGTFVRHVGREGEGPGEYQLVNFLFRLPGDSVEAVDIRLGRATVLDPSLQVARTGPYVGSVGFVTRLADGTHVSAGRVRVAGSEGLPLHVFAPSGRIARSFGADPPLDAAAAPDLFRRQFAVRPDSTSFWAGHLTRYVLEEWSDERLRRRLVRRADWFPPHDDYGIDGPDGEPPTPGLAAVHVDEEGLLWTAVVVPDADWRTAFGPELDRLGRPVVDRDRAYDTIIEAIDPATATVVGRVRIDERVSGFADDGLPFTMRESGAGEIVIRVWRVLIP